MERARPNGMFSTKTTAPSRHVQRVRKMQRPQAPPTRPALKAKTEGQKHLLSTGCGRALRARTSPVATDLRRSAAEEEAEVRGTLATRPKAAA